MAKNSLLPEIFWSYKSLWLNLFTFAAAFFSAFFFINDEISFFLYATIYAFSYLVWSGKRHLISHIGLDYFGLFAKRVSFFLLALFLSKFLLSYMNIRLEVTQILTAYAVAEFVILVVSAGVGLILRHRRLSQIYASPIIIFGAGNAGTQIVEQLRDMYSVNVVALIDDDDSKIGGFIAGVQVVSRQKAHDIIKQKGVRDILVAVPGLSLEELNIISELYSPLGVVVKTLPSERAGAPNVDIGDFVGLDLDELLGRSSAAVRGAELCNLKDVTVVISGGAGSIGSELTRICLHEGAAKVIVLDNSEFNLYQLSQSVEEDFMSNGTLLLKLIDIKDSQAVNSIFSAFDVDLVFHAAAYKHVPLVEDNIFSAVENNIFGTDVICEACCSHGVKQMVLVSTDKAVRPTNVMGATKRVAELLLSWYQGRYPKIKFCAVRFGNVIGSSGSVIPKFSKQIRSGGPVTITHPEITRYFMSNREACELVVTASGISVGGETFILDMGTPVKIYDVAKKMIESAGYVVAKDDAASGITIQTTGLRPGEKLYEELLVDSTAVSTEHPKIYKASEPLPDALKLEHTILELRGLAELRDEDALKACMALVVEGFRYENGLNA